jgi:hypothetical protein
MKRRGWVCAALAVALHAALIIGWSAGGQASRSTGGSVGAHPAGPADRATRAGAAIAAPALVARLILRPGPEARQAAPALGAQAGAEARPTATDAAAPAAEPAPARSSAAAARLPVDRPVGPVGPALAEAPIGSRDQGLDDYVPRPRLTVVPRPGTDIRLAYPADGPAIGRFVATLTLYIDDEGWVRRVEVAGDETLPAELRLAAREAFAGLRFSPGEVDGIVVKSRLRIEAIFESLAWPARAQRLAALAAAPTRAATNAATSEQGLHQP